MTLDPYFRIITNKPRHLIHWSLSKMVTELGSHLSEAASLPAPNSDKALQFTSVELPSLCKGQLELAHRWLTKTGFTVAPIVRCLYSMSPMVSLL